MESAVLHHVAMAGGNAAASLESFTGSDDLVALKHVLERTQKPASPQEETVARIESRGARRYRRRTAGRAARRDARERRAGGRIARDAGPRRHFRGRADLRDLEAAGARGAGRGFCGQGRQAQSGSRLEADRGIAGLRRCRSKRGSCSRPRSPAGSSTPESCRCTPLGENSDGRLFYAMRLVRGETLKERIRKFHGRARSASSRSRFGSCSIISCGSATSSLMPTAGACCTAT